MYIVKDTSRNGDTDKVAKSVIKAFKAKGDKRASADAVNIAIANAVNVAINNENLQSSLVRLTSGLVALNAVALKTIAGDFLLDMDAFQYLNLVSRKPVNLQANAVDLANDLSLKSERVLGWMILVYTNNMTLAPGTVKINVTYPVAAGETAIAIPGTYSADDVEYSFRPAQAVSAYFVPTSGLAENQDWAYSGTGTPGDPFILNRTETDAVDRVGYLPFRNSSPHTIDAVNFDLVKEQPIVIRVEAANSQITICPITESGNNLDVLPTVLAAADPTEAWSQYWTARLANYATMSGYAINVDACGLSSRCADKKIALNTESIRDNAALKNAMNSLSV